MLAAERATSDARAAVKLLRNVFRVADPISLGGRGFADEKGELKNVTARQLLDLGLENVESELVSEPKVYAAMLETLGDVYRAIGELDKAEPLLVKSLAIRERFTPQEPEDLAASRFCLGCLRHDQGRLGEAEDLYRQSLAIREEVLGKDDRRTANTRFQLAWVLSMRFEPANGQQLAEAESLFTQVIASRRKATPVVTRELGLAQAALGFLQYARGNEIGAIASLNDALATLEGQDSISSIAEKYVLYHTYWRGGRRSDALALHAEVVAQFAALAGEVHPLHVLLLGEHAGLLSKIGDASNAEAAVRRALTLGQRTSFRWHFAAIDAWLKLGDVERARGDLAGARASYARGLEVATKLDRPADVALLKQRLAEVAEKRQ